MGNVSSTCVFAPGKGLKSGLSGLAFSTLYSIFDRPFPLLPACPTGCAGRAVQRVLTGWGKGCAAIAAPPPPVLHHFSVQFSVRMEHSGAEIAAQKRIGNGLYTGAWLPIVQQKAVAAVIIGAKGTDELSGPAKMRLIHARQIIHPRTPA